MGCDIHFFTERYTKDTNYDGPKSKSEERDIKLGTILNEDISPRWVSADQWEFEDGYWSVIDELYGGRNYSLFEKLAGVRGHGERNSICPARVFPIDASSGYTVMVDQWDGDGHSHSFFTLTELLKENFDDYREFKETVESMKLIDSDPDKIRCVFFFDN